MYLPVSVYLITIVADFVWVVQQELWKVIIFPNKPHVFGVQYMFHDFCVSKQPWWDTWLKFSINSSKPASRLLGILNKQQECHQAFNLKNKKGIVNISLSNKHSYALKGPRHYGRKWILRRWGVEVQLREAALYDLTCEAKLTNCRNREVLPNSHTSSRFISKTPTVCRLQSQQADTHSALRCTLLKIQDQSQLYQHWFSVKIIVKLLPGVFLLSMLLIETQLGDGSMDFHCRISHTCKVLIVDDMYSGWRRHIRQRGSS